MTGSGTTDDPYLISNAGCWDLFCDLIEHSTYTFTGNVKLCANISVSRMAGSESKPFCGHFDGQNNTLTFNYNTGNDPIHDYIAPFRYVKGSIGNAYHHATISNLYVDSHIIGENATHLAGFIANQKGLVDVTNCHVQAAITSTATTDSYCAGLVSHADLSDNYGNANDGTLTISGCTVSGSIVTYGKYTGGFVGMAEGKTSIVNSVSGVTINSIVSGNGTHGGFIGLQQHTMNYTGVKTTIEGCLFNGKLITSNGTTNCGGFIGWHDGGSLEIKHCLYAPADLDSGETEISDGSTFVGNGTVGFNCIYTRALGTAQGKASRSIIAGEYVTISNIALINFLSNPDVYNVSGITSYDWGGINCGGDLYFCEGAHVSLVLSNNCPDPAPAGSVYGYTASGGTLEKNGNGTYTLTMPDADVTIDATIMPPSEVSYIDEHGMEQTVTALPLTGSETILDPGWYVVENTNPNGVDLAYTEGLSCSDGNLNLILCDGAEMTVTGAYSYDAITLDGESTLTIYGQSQQSGKLTLTGSEYGKCIQTNDGNIVINGGIVNATADTDGAIKCNSFTMNGGSFSATSNSSYDYDHAIQISDSFTFNGGNFSAIATNPGQFGIEGAWSSVNLSWTNTSDSFYVSSLGQVSINIAEGKDFIDDENNIHTSDDPGDIAGKTLRPFNGYYSPKNLTVTGITLSSAMLTWEAGNNETQWQVSWSTDGGSTWSDPVTVNNEPQYEITNLNPETTVQVQVKSIYSEGQSFPTSITFTTRSLCDAPENLTAAPIASSATLNWAGYQDSYNVRYCELTVGDAVTTTEDFEHDGEMPEGWTKLDLGDGENTAELGVSTDAAQNGGSYGFRFSSYAGNSEGSFDQYLISPELYDITALSFAYKSSNGTTDVFRVGYSTTTNDVSAFTWGDEINSVDDWTVYSENANSIPANAKYFAINYTAVYQYRLYIDDITYTCRPLITGAWNETNTNVTSPLTISGLTSETQYAWQVQGINADCDGGLTEWSEIGTFATLSLPPVSYIDENGQQQLRTKYVTLNGTETTLGTTGQETWYVADSTLDYSQTITLNGDVHLILKDNATMTVSGGYINGCVPNHYNYPEPTYDLNIYGQSTGNDRGSLTINGSGEAIRCDGITINGGKVTANSGHFAAVAIDANNVTINGGQVIANGGEDVHGIEADGITLGWQNMNDYIFATRYRGSITIADGKAFIDVEGNTYSGSGITGIDGKTLYPSVVSIFTKEIAAHGAGNGGWYLIASPLATAVNPVDVGMITDNYTGDDNSQRTYDLYYFDQSGGDNGREWKNYRHNTFNLESGKGYLYANSEDVNLTFIVAPHSSDSIINLVYSDECADTTMRGWNLVGNPFPCIAYVDRPFYTMNYDGDEIVPVSESERSVEAMQGIFVIANYDGEPLTFTTIESESNDNSKSMLALNLSQGHGLIDRAIVRFSEGSALPKFQLFEGSTKVYIPQDGKDYAVINAEAQGEMPVNFKAKENGTYTLSFTNEEVSFSYLHLIDNMTGDDIDLLQTPSYTFKAKKTDYDSRFKLVFAVGSSTGSDTFAFYSNGNWVINNEGRATLQVIDLTGRILSSEEINGSVSKAISGVAGVYMIRLINGDNVRVQKIVVK
ncbi:MAG: fibronectin type III domain-containing protein [Bacteroidales bacterium]|nr:fibronectin type III domain-containing protein [Bacteroidales bacterium]